MRALAAALLLAAVAAPLAAQVGHAPGSSPYRDLTESRSLTVSGGWFSKNAGSYGLGPNDGYTVGIRYGLRANRFLELSLGATVADLQRNTVDQFTTLAQRTKGPFKERVTLVEGAFTFNLTGGKTWRGLAPFAGFGFGAAIPNNLVVANDTSGYRTGTKFIFTPHAGTRVFLTRKLHLRLEAKGVLWRLKYPLTFGNEPPAEPGIPPNRNAVITNGRYSQWVANANLQAGLGYAIKLF